MKLAVSNIGWTAAEDATIAPLLLEAGAEAIEVAPGRIFDDPALATVVDAQAVSKLWSARGLPIVSMQALLFGQTELRLFGDEATQAAHETYLSHIIKLAGPLGCGPLVYGSPKNRTKGDMSFTQAKVAVRPALRRIGDIAQANGTTFCLEANATGYGCDFMTKLSEAGAVAQAADHSAIAMVADTGNMLMEHEDPSELTKLTDQIQHLHISAPQLGPVLEHSAYVSEVFKTMSGLGYDGSVTLEMRPGDGTKPLENLLRATSFLRNLIEQD